MRSAGAGLRRVNHRNVCDMSALRFTVDHPDDLELVRALVAEVGDRRFDVHDLVRVIARRPELTEMNRHGRNEGSRMETK
jgi:spore coat polysaccharide biosynthesis protein SpsF